MITSLSYIPVHTPVITDPGYVPVHTCVNMGHGHIPVHTRDHSHVLVHTRVLPAHTRPSASTGHTRDPRARAAHAHTCELTRCPTSGPVAVPLPVPGDSGPPWGSGRGGRMLTSSVSRPARVGQGHARTRVCPHNNARVGHARGGFPGVVPGARPGIWGGFGAPLLGVPPPPGTAGPPPPAPCRETAGQEVGGRGRTGRGGGSPLPGLLPMQRPGPGGHGGSGVSPPPIGVTFGPQRPQRPQPPAGSSAGRGEPPGAAQEAASAPPAPPLPRDELGRG